MNFTKEEKNTIIDALEYHLEGVKTALVYAISDKENNDLVEERENIEALLAKIK